MLTGSARGALVLLLAVVVRATAEADAPTAADRQVELAGDTTVSAKAETAAPTGVGLHPTITLADVLAQQPPPSKRPGIAVFEAGKGRKWPEDFTGVSIQRDAGGVVRFEWEYQQGQPHGRLLWYYASGARQGESIAQDGHDHGPWVMWYENGKVREQGFIGENHNHHGEWVYYFPTGVKAAEGRFDRGRPWGTWQSYDGHGKPIAEGTYRDGEPWDGTFVVSHQSSWDQPYQHLLPRTFAAGKPILTKFEADRLVAVLAGTDDGAKPEALRKLADAGASGLAAVLGKLRAARGNDPAVAPLVRELGHAVAARRKAARQKLLATGSSAFAPLVAATTDPDPEIRLRAREILRAIELKDGPLYFATAELATRLGRAGADAIPILAEMLSCSPDLQLAALKALGQIGGAEARSALPALQRCAQASDPAVAAQARVVIERLAPAAPE